MNRVELTTKSFEELNELRLSIENNQTNRLPKGSFNLYTTEARRKLSDIAWAITNKLRVMNT